MCVCVHGVQCVAKCLHLVACQMVLFDVKEFWQCFSVLSCVKSLSVLCRFTYIVVTSKLSIAIQWNLSKVDTAGTQLVVL